MVVSLIFLSLAMKVLPVGTAYAVWTGIGAVGTVILGIVLFRRARHRFAARLRRPHLGRHRGPEALGLDAIPPDEMIYRNDSLPRKF